MVHKQSIGSPHEYYQGDAKIEVFAKEMEELLSDCDLKEGKG